MTAHRRGWVVDVIVGGGLGLVLGWIAAGNAAICLGADGGYEATLPQLLAEGPVVAVIVLALLVAGPVLGVVVSRRMRAGRRRGSRHPGESPDEDLDG